MLLLLTSSPATGRFRRSLLRMENTSSFSPTQDLHGCPGFGGGHQRRERLRWTAAAKVTHHRVAPEPSVATGVCIIRTLGAVCAALLRVAAQLRALSRVHGLLVPVVA
jgi:hypothetical protein